MNIIDHMQGIPCWGERLAKLQKIFVESFRKSSPDFQSEHGYALDEPNQANLNICAHAVSSALYIFVSSLCSGRHLAGASHVGMLPISVLACTV